MSHNHTQKVTIEGNLVDYSRNNLRQEVQSHTHFVGAEKGLLKFLPSVNAENVMTDIVTERGITSDTLYAWINEEMCYLAEAYQSDPPKYRTWDQAEQGGFFVDMLELEQLFKLFCAVVAAEK